METTISELWIPEAPEGHFRLGPGVAPECPPAFKILLWKRRFRSSGAPEAPGSHFGPGPGVAPECIQLQGGGDGVNSDYVGLTLEWKAQT